MISIEAHCASIGRFTGSAKFLAQIKSCQNFRRNSSITVSCDVIGSSVLWTNFHNYDIVVPYILALLMLTLTYRYMFWIVQHSSELSSVTVRKIAKKAELMRDPSLPGEIKVHPLIPCLIPCWMVGANI